MWSVCGCRFVGNCDCLLCMYFCLRVLSRAQSYAERLRLGLAVMHGEAQCSESDMADGRHSPPPMSSGRTTSGHPGLELPCKIRLTRTGVCTHTLENIPAFDHNTQKSLLRCSHVYNLPNQQTVLVYVTTSVRTGWVEPWLLSIRGIHRKVMSLNSRVKPPLLLGSRRHWDWPTM